MPFLEFECPNGHVTEHFYKTISAGASMDYVICMECGINNNVMAKKTPSRPLGFGLYGDPAGYDKPSTTRRYSTKTSEKHGNSNSAG